MIAFSIVRMCLCALVLYWISSCEIPEDNFKEDSLTQLTFERGDQSNPIFSNQGRYMTYQSNQNGVWDIYLYDLKSDKTIKITNSENDYKDVQWAPDDKFVSFTSYPQGESQILVYELATGTSKSLTSVNQGASNAHWSPDGKNLIVDINSGGKDLWQIDLSSGELDQITSFHGDESNFGFSNDGLWIGFTSRGSDYPHLQAINSETGEVKQLIYDQTGHEWHPRWSRQKFEITFYSTWNNEMTDIWLTDGSVEGLNRITHQKIEEFGPALSHSENLIAYFSWDKANEIAIYDRSASSESSLELANELIVVWNPLDWSRDRNILAFTGMHEMDRLYAVSPELGSNELVLPDRAHNFEVNASYDQTGNYLLFNDQYNIVIRDLSTGEETVIPPEEDHFTDVYPTWIPNSKNRIAYLHGVGGASDTNNIWTMNLDGSDRTPLTTIGGIKNYVWVDEDNIVFGYDATTSYEFYDIWTYNIKSKEAKPLIKEANVTLSPTSVSPDGKVLLFNGDYDGINKTYKVPTNGGKYQQVPNNIDSGESAVFSPDGNTIAFSSNQNKEKTFDIYTMSAEGGYATRITNSQEVEYGLFWSFDGSSIMFSANKGDKDIYLVDVDQRLEDLRKDKP